MLKIAQAFVLKPRQSPMYQVYKGMKHPANVKSSILFQNAAKSLTFTLLPYIFSDGIQNYTASRIK